MVDENGKRDRQDDEGKEEGQGGKVAILIVG